MRARKGVVRAKQTSLEGERGSEAYGDGSRRDGQSEKQGRMKRGTERNYSGEGERELGEH